MLRPLAAALLAALSGACATVESTSLVPEPVRVETPLGESVHVSAVGTGRSMGIGPALVSASDLADAVRTAAQQCGLFDSAAEAGEAAWLLAVAVGDLERPEAGLDMTATVVLEWTLTRRASGAVHWRDSIETSHTATPEDAFDFSERGMIAVQEALRANIESALGRMGRLE